jgi:hypothetical protein
MTALQAGGGVVESSSRKLLMHSLNQIQMTGLW